MGRQIKSIIRRLKTAGLGVLLKTLHSGFALKQQFRGVEETCTL